MTNLNHRNKALTAYCVRLFIHDINRHSAYSDKNIFAPCPHSINVKKICVIYGFYEISNCSLRYPSRLLQWLQSLISPFTSTGFLRGNTIDLRSRWEDNPTISF